MEVNFKLQNKTKPENIKIDMTDKNQIAPNFASLYIEICSKLTDILHIIYRVHFFESTSTDGKKREVCHTKNED